MIDPETGENLGGYRLRKATVEADFVASRYTIAVPVKPSWLARYFRSMATTERSPITGLPGPSGIRLDPEPEPDPEPRLPVDRSQIQPLPTSSKIGVGDVAELLETPEPATTPPAVEEQEPNEPASADAPTDANDSDSTTP